MAINTTRVNRFKNNNATINSVRIESGQQTSIVFEITAALATVIVILLSSLFFSNVRAAETNEWVYTVRPGDSVWSITERYLLTKAHAPRLIAHNKLDAKGSLIAGSRIKMPLEWLRTSTTPAKIQSVSGSGVLVTSRSKKSYPLSEGALLRPQDKIATGDNTTVVIEFADKSTMTIRSNSEVVMDSLSVYGNAGFVDTRVRLQRGRSSNAFVPNTGTPAKYEVHTPAGISAVRGTHYRVSTEGKVSRTETLEGKVAVGGSASPLDLTKGSGAILGAVAVAAGYGTTKEADKPALPPVELLAAPDTNAMPEITTIAKLEWPTVGGAENYRVVLADNKSFMPLLKEAVVASNALVIDELPDAMYYVKLNAIDGNGIEGFESDKQFELNARPFAPSLAVLAKADGVIRGKFASLRWKAPVDATGVLIELADSEDFAKLLLEKNFDKQASSHKENLPDGTYFWRMASLGVDGKFGPYSDTQSFTLEHEPVAPKVSGKVEGNSAIFSWPADPRAAEYEVKVYRENDFSKPFATAVVKDNKYRVENLKFGHYDARVVAIAGDGYRGAPGALAKVIVAAEGVWSKIAKGFLGR